MADRRRWARWLPSLLFGLLSLESVAQAPPSAFVAESIYAGPNGMISMQFDPAGRLLVAEKQGRLMRFEPNGSGGFQTPPQVYADFVAQVDPFQEAGLLGFVLDPDHANNRYLYVGYTTATDQRVVRHRANASFTAVEAGSGLVLLSGLPRQVMFHKAGDLHFSPADPTALYLTLGDDGDRAPAQNPDRYEGKLLRFDAATGLGLPDNPFWDGNPSSVRSRVFATGLRNAFRFAFHPGRPSSTVLYSSENGDATDRLSRISRGSNGAWGPGGDSGGFLSPPDPGHRVLFTGPPSHIGIAISPSGPFGTDVLYLGKWFAGPLIRRFQLTGGNLDNATLLDGGTFINGEIAIDLRFGPDGHLYYTQTGGDASTGGFYQLRRIRFTGGSPPVAAFATNPSPAAGTAPLLVQFTDQSSAPGSSIASRTWDFGDGQTSTQTHPQHTYSTPGLRSATLTVTNALGQSASTSRSIRATRPVQLNLQFTIRDGRTLAAPGLAAATELHFYEADGHTPLAVSGGSGPAQNVRAVAAGGVVNLTLSSDVAGNALVVSAGEAAGDGVQPALRGWLLSDGAGPHLLQGDFILSDTLLTGRVLDTRDQPLPVDVGLQRGTPFAPYATPQGRDFLPGSGVPVSGINHRKVSDALGYFHFPWRSGDSGALRLDAVADTGTASHPRVTQDDSIAAGQRRDLVLRVGRWSAGNDCDDLAAIPPTPAVDYQTQIQPIWAGACTGCHVATASNNGGLDLTTGNSLAQLRTRLSLQAPGVPLLTDGQTGRSFLFEKINCNAPQAGTRMRPANPMPLAQQALIRDWISQQGVLFVDGFED